MKLLAFLSPPTIIQLYYEVHIPNLLYYSYMKIRTGLEAHHV